MPLFPEPTKEPVLAGKVALVTGSNTGIGFEAAGILANQSPATLILAVRSIPSGEKAREELLKAHPEADIRVWPLDLASFASVRAFADKANELAHLDVAVLNAGVAPGSGERPLQATADGHELTHQVNVLSTLLLALLLVPALRRAAEPSLVIVSSEVHAWADSEFVVRALAAGSLVEAVDDPAQYVNDKRYFLSKLLLQLGVRRLLPALPGIRTVSTTPGLCMTGLARGYTEAEQQAMYARGARTAHDGAVAVTTAIFSPKSEEFWADCHATPSPSAFMHTPAGDAASAAYWAELLPLFEKIAPGSTGVLKA
ncbi:Short chain dehydrogenase sol3 [Vanrija pseudolonga]|uniref:Short chain dehydrogenase sol3 n=1 Tax=Vanrija pseudolonga TaxID=143232 RepID=A0AAF1BJD1_9TREE|nr:Short chain dehydrogenase sol3 [Vanrija pseudolonga]